MIGLGPHEMTAWLWAVSIGLTVVFAVLTGLSVFIAVKLIERERGERVAHD